VGISGRYWHSHPNYRSDRPQFALSCRRFPSNSRYTISCFGSLHKWSAKDAYTGALSARFGLDNLGRRPWLYKHRRRLAGAGHLAGECATTFPRAARYTTTKIADYLLVHSPLEKSIE